MMRFGTQRDDIFDRSFYDGHRPPAVGIFESDDPGDLAVGDFSGQQLRSMAMSAALAFINGGDYSFEALDIIAVGMVDADSDGEVSEDEEEDYNELLVAIGEAFERLGATADDVIAFIDNEDEAAGKKIGRRLTEKLDNTDLSDDDLIVRHAAAKEAIFEATVRTVRGGKLVLKKKRIKKYRMSAAQRAALKKARRKAFTAAARRNRKKSMRVRKQRGL